MNHQNNLKEKKFSIFLCTRKQIHSHSHDFLELAYVLKGSAIHNWDNASAEINEGDYFVIDYRSQHSYVAKTNDFELINCLFLPEFIDSSLMNCRSLGTLISSYQIHFNKDFFAKSPSACIYKDEDGKAKELLLKMLKEFSDQAPGYLQIIRSAIIELLVTTMRMIYLDFTPYEDDNDTDKILRCIATEYINDLSLGEICQRFGYSFSYLSAKLKKETGFTFTKLLKKARIEESMRLLAHTKKPISVISSDVGYTDIKSFYSAFKEIANTTPAKFRKNYFGNI